MEAIAFTWSFPGGATGLAATASLLLALVCVSYFFTVRKLTAPMKLVPLALRLLALALITFCLCAPVKVLERKTAPKGDKPKIAIVMDKSSSMTLKGVKGRSRLEEASAEVKDCVRANSEDFDFSFFSFANSLVQENSLDSTAADPQDNALRPTALYKSIAEWTRRNGGAYKAAIWLSDGVDTASGAGIEQAVDALESGSPPIVFAAMTTTLKSKQSIEIERIEAPDGVRTGSDAQVTTILRCSGLDPATPLELKIKENGKQIWSERIEVASRGTFTKAIGASVPVRTQGIHSFESALVLGGREEAAAKWSVYGIEAPRLKVLLYMGSLDWGVRFMRRAFEDSDKISIDIRYAPDFLGSATGAPPKAKENFLRPDFLEQYDVALFMDLRRDQIPPEMETRLREYLSTGGSLLFLIPNAETAEAYASTPIEKLLPATFEKVSGSEGSQLDDKTRQFVEQMRRHREGLMMERSSRAKPGDMELPPLTKMSITDAGGRSGIFDYVSSGGVIDPLGIPSFEEFALIKEPKAGAEVLATHPIFKDAAGNPRALFAVQRFGQGRSALLATDPLWRWRMTLDSKCAHFENFWSHIITWLCAGAESRPHWVLNSLVVPSGKSIQLRFAIPPRTLSFKDLEFSAEKAGDTQTLALRPTERPDQFECEITPESGRLTTLRAKKAGQIVAEASITGGPAPAERELEMLRPDIAGLRRMAAACDGLVVERLAEVDFKKFLPPPSEASITREETQLWHNPLIFVAILLLIIAELLARRRLKMV